MWMECFASDTRIEGEDLEAIASPRSDYGYAVMRRLAAI
jgi:hypothetical protein